VLALETIQGEAAASGTPFSDHVSHLVVHGCLHLLGYDHRTAADAARMEGLERAILAGLGIADPYADPPERRIPATDGVRALEKVP
jgi:probable rRNA maturation factor